MKMKYVLVMFAMLMIFFLSQFAMIYQKSGKLSGKVVGLITATCMPPAGMLLFLNRRKRR